VAVSGRLLVAQVHCRTLLKPSDILIAGSIQQQAPSADNLPTVNLVKLICREFDCTLYVGRGWVSHPAGGVYIVCVPGWDGASHRCQCQCQYEVYSAPITKRTWVHYIVHRIQS